MATSLYTNVGIAFMGRSHDTYTIEDSSFHRVLGSTHPGCNCHHQNSNLALPGLHFWVCRSFLVYRVTSQYYS